MPEEEHTGNEGHQMVTSGNTLVYGHPLNNENWVADQYGVMATRLVGGMRLGEADTHFEPPGELIIPALDKPFDDVYASAIYVEIAKGGATARRIAHALDWLGIAWRNTSAIEVGTRIVALRAGFEVLFGVGNSTRAVRQSLGTLLDPRGVERPERTWDEHGKTRGPEAMSDLEWWFQHFSMLRNAIMHGDEVSAAAWRHGDHDHVWIAEDCLRRSIKETLIRAGHPADLRDDPATRALAPQIAERLSESDPPLAGTAETST